VTVRIDSIPNSLSFQFPDGKPWCLDPGFLTLPLVLTQVASPESSDSYEVVQCEPSEERSPPLFPNGIDYSVPCSPTPWQPSPRSSPIDSALVLPPHIERRALLSSQWLSSSDGSESVTSPIDPWFLAVVEESDTDDYGEDFPQEEMWHNSLYDPTYDKNQ